MIAPVEIKSRLAEVNERIRNALISAGRADAPVTLVAVTKTFPAEYATAAIECGVTDIGESKVQESEAKKPLVRGSVRWHLIGHLQTNKVRKALEIYDLIQSVDSYKLAREISRQASQPVEILVQVNTSGEDSKYGLEPSAAREEILRISELEHVRVMGLMTIGPYVEDESAIRKSFRELRRMFEDLVKFESDKLKMAHLSMGMSGDFELALAEGANMLRVGSSIFGPRG